MIKKRTYYAFAIMAVIIVMVNLMEVFGLDTLIRDDLGRYYHFIDHYFSWQSSKKNVLLPFYHAVFQNVTVISPVVARAMVLILLMIPASWLFFKLLHDYFNIPAFIAFIIAVLPPLLPNQIMYPAFIDGSYVLAALIFYFLSLIYGLRYAGMHAPTLYYSLSVVTFVIMAGISEMCVFLTVPMCLIYLFTIDKKRKSLLILTVCLISLSKVVATFLKKHPAANAGFLSTGEILDRIRMSYEFINPLSANSGLILSYLTLGLILAVCSFGTYLSLTRPPAFKSDKKIFNFNRKYLPLFILVFSFLWYLSTSLPFYLFSPFIESRHFYIASFGFSLFLIFSLYLVFITYLPERKFLVYMLFGGLLLFSGYGKINNFNQFRKIQNESHNHFKQELYKYDFPSGSQIVITGRSAILTDGWWYWSSGYLRYLLKRDDIAGMMPYHLNYYDPFNGEKGRKYTSGMTGLDLDHPIFLFANYDIFHQMKYALQWKERDTQYSAWMLYKFDPLSGESSVFTEGEGYREYVNTIDSLRSGGILRQEDILFGGIPSGADSLRLGL